MRQKQVDRPTKDPLQRLRIRISPPGSMIRYWYAATMEEALQKSFELQAKIETSFAIIDARGKVLRVIKSNGLQWATASSTKGGNL